MPILSRRNMLSLSGFGLGQLAVADLVGTQATAAKRIPVFDDLRVRESHFPPPAKAVIQLLQSGGPSQMNLFDPKPARSRLPFVEDDDFQRAGVLDRVEFVEEGFAEVLVLLSGGQAPGIDGEGEADTTNTVNACSLAQPIVARTLFTHDRAEVSSQNRST